MLLPMLFLKKYSEHVGGQHLGVKLILLYYYIVILPKHNSYGT